MRGWGTVVAHLILTIDDDDLEDKTPITINNKAINI